MKRIERTKGTPRPGARVKVPEPEVTPPYEPGKLWQHGDLFHATMRYPQKRGAPKIDRLAGILKHGLVAPSHGKDGSVCSDLNLVMSGCGVDYYSIVFLHLLGKNSWLYTMIEPGRFFVFIDRSFPVLTPEQMPEPWVILCQDEVYVRDRVPVEKLTAIVVHPDDAADVMREFLPEFQRLRLPLHECGGKVLWTPDG